MFETTFSYKSSTPLPPSVSINTALELLHDFEVVNRLNPDVRGQKPIPPPTNGAKKPAAAVSAPGSHPLGQTQYFEVEDDLPFIPKKLWSGGVKYQADFLPLEEGCDITIHAPGGFTSINHWRLVHQEDRTADVIHEDSEEGITASQASGGSGAVQPIGNRPGGPARSGSKNLLHADREGGSGGGQWFVQIVSDAKCNRTFANFVKGFLKNSHTQLETAFVEKAKQSGGINGAGVNGNAQRPGPGARRPTLGRRRSSKF